MNLSLPPRPSSELPLLGEATVLFDKKFRFCMPAHFRGAFPNSFVLLPGDEGTLRVLPLPLFRVLEKETLNAARENSTNQLNAQHLFSAAFVVEGLDTAGRVAVPSELRRRLGFEPNKNLLITGARSFVEVWSEAAWRSHHAQGTLWAGKD